jgi:hypothetical protein
MIYMMILIIISLTAQNGERQESFEGFTSGIRANAVKGDVLYQRDDAKFNLEAGHKLQEGDLIKTESNSYAELLLQPGNYLRVGADSELQIFSDSADKIRLKLNYGAISLEILSKEGEDSSRYYESLSQIYELIRVFTPNAEVFITRSGIFRINSMGPGRTELIVRDGEAVINGRRVKEKRNAVASREGVAIADLNSKLEDGFDAWSRERAEELIRANRSLKQEAPWAKNRKDEDQTTMDFPEDERQTKRNRLVVSARPGVVNFAEAGVEFSRPSKEWERLTEKSQLETGDKVRTSAHSFAEISLLPDINLRIDGKSELLFEQLSNESMSLKLLQGAAILDVARFESKEGPQISLAGASASVVIADEGNYRIDLKPDGDEFTIRDGKVIFKERQIGSCRKIFAGTVSDCDKKASDNFDVWSDHRGEGKFYHGRGMISMVSHLDRLRRIRNRNTGFWFQNPGKTHYTFVPFYSPLFRSPYGGSYSTVLSPRRLMMMRPDLRDRSSGRFPGPIMAPWV